MIGLSSCIFQVDVTSFQLFWPIYKYDELIFNVIFDLIFHDSPSIYVISMEEFFLTKKMNDQIHGVLDKVIRSVQITFANEELIIILIDRPPDFQFIHIFLVKKRKYLPKNRILCLMKKWTFSFEWNVIYGNIAIWIFILSHRLTYAESSVFLWIKIEFMIPTYQRFSTICWFRRLQNTPIVGVSIDSSVIL